MYALGRDGSGIRRLREQQCETSPRSQTAPDPSNRNSEWEMSQRRCRVFRPKRGEGVKMSIEDQWEDEAEQSSPAETVAHLSEEEYRSTITELSGQVLTTLLYEDGAIESVRLDIILGCLRPIEEICSSNPFSVLEHSRYELDPSDWERVNHQDPVPGLVEQAQRLLAGDVQQRILEAVADSETEIPIRTQPQRGQQR